MENRVTLKTILVTTTKNIHFLTLTGLMGHLRTMLLQSGVRFLYVKSKNNRFVHGKSINNFGRCQRSLVFAGVQNQFLP